jgi:hypothetical protein
MQAGGFGGANNPLGQIIEEMMKQSGSLGGGPSGGLGGEQAAPQRRAPQPSNQGNNPFGNNPLGDTPFGKVLQDMFGGGQPGEQPEPQRRAPPEARAKNPYDDIFGQMFETGRQQRDDYQRGIESVFDQFLRGMDRNR